MDIFQQESRKKETIIRKLYINGKSLSLKQESISLERDQGNTGQNIMAMNLQSTKESVIKRVEQVDDINLLNALNSLLDYGLRKQEAGGGGTDPAFLASLERGLAQSARGEGRPHQEVMQELRNKYSE